MSLRRQSRRTGRGGGGAVEPPKIGILSISPPFATVNDGDTPMTITGFGFTATSVVRINGVDQTTGFGGPTTLTLTVFDALLDNPGFLNIEVFDPFYPASASTQWPVNYTVPTTVSLSPSSVVNGASNTPVVITGTNFFNAATVARVDDTAVATSFTDSTHVTATIPASMLTTVGTRSITVFNPVPGGGLSNSQTFTITSAIPLPYTITGLAYWLDPSRYADGTAGAWTLGTMGTVTAAGTPTPPTLTLSGTATSAINLRVQIDGAGTLGVATFRYSLNGTTSWVATNVPTAASVGPFAGITLSFAAGTYATDHTYAANVRIVSAPSRESQTNVIDATKTMTHATATSQPRLILSSSLYNNNPVLEFAGGQSYATPVWSAPLNVPATHYLVGHSAPNATFQTFLDNRDGTGSTGRHWILKRNTTENIEGREGSGIAQTATTFNNVHVICYVINTSDIGIYIDSPSTLKGTAAVTTAALASRGISVGLPLTGNFATTLSYSGAHSLADRTTLMSYLSTKYGVP